MAASERDDGPRNYEPGDPRSFGEPPRIPPDDELAGDEGLEEVDLSPMSLKKRVRAAIDGIAWDRWRSMLPPLKEGTILIREVLPKFVTKYGLSEFPPGLRQDSANIYDQILSRLWEGDDQVGVGGLETRYTFLNKPPDEQSYEYIGEAIGRAIRNDLAPIPDLSHKTEAFFGWIGRVVMKSVFPQTDFSFDRHQEMAVKEQKEWLSTLRSLRAKLEVGITGKLTLKAIHDFFYELEKDLPQFLSANTPLEHRLASDIFDGDYFPDEQDFNSFCRRWAEATEIGVPKVEILPPWEDDRLYGASISSYQQWMEYVDGFYQRNPEDFRKGNRAYYHMLKRLGVSKPSDLSEKVFMKWYERWAKNKVKRRQNWTLYYWREKYGKAWGGVLSDLRKMKEANHEDLLRYWYEMNRIDLLEDLKWGEREAKTFKTSYFRFIDNKDVAEGYAFAQKHINFLRVNLPKVVRMSEEEIWQRFFKGDPGILGGKGDYGRNYTDEMYEEADDQDPGEWFHERSKLSEEDLDLYYKIKDGPNADLYKQLLSIKFTQKQHDLGIIPLFFGIEYSDRFARAVLAGKTDEFFKEERQKTPFQRERKRISELKSGVFRLPKNIPDLLVNADFQIQRLEESATIGQSERFARIEAILEVKKIIEEAQRRGIL